VNGCRNRPEAPGSRLGGCWAIFGDFTRQAVYGSREEPVAALSCYTEHARESELESLLDYIRPGDVVTVTRLDRLARSTKTYWILPSGSKAAKWACGALPSHGQTPQRQRAAWC